MIDLNIQHYRDEIAFTEVYRNERAKELHPGDNICNAMGHGALWLAQKGTEQSGYRSHEADVFNVIALIEPFATNQKKLDTLQQASHPSKHNEKTFYLKKVIEFNHALKDMVDRNPRLGFSDVTRFTTQAYSLMNVKEIQSLSPEARQDRLGWFQNAIRRSSNGMRHEIGFEQILGSLDDIDYDETTVEGEIEGIDFYVSLNGNEFGVDVKSSPTKAKQKCLQQRNDGYRPNAIWSHLDDRDFGNSFRVSPELASQKAAAVREDLQMLAYYQAVA